MSYSCFQAKFVEVIGRAAESVEIGKELPGKSYMLTGN